MVWPEVGAWAWGLKSSLMLWGMTFSSFFISALVTYLLITAHPFTTGQHRSSLTARGAACTFEYAHGLALDVLRERAWPVAHVQRDSIEEVLLRPDIWGGSGALSQLPTTQSTLQRGRHIPLSGVSYGTQPSKKKPRTSIGSWAAKWIVSIIGARSLMRRP